MRCPKCEYKIDEPFEECQYKLLDSGKGYNDTFGQVEHWFRVDLTCPECQHVFNYSDSSL